MCDAEAKELDSHVVLASESGTEMQFEQEPRYSIYVCLQLTT